MRLVVDYSASHRLVVDYFVTRLIDDFFDYAARSDASARTRLVTRLVDDFFDYAARPGASAHYAARRATHRRLLRLRRASGCLGMSRSSSSNTSPTSYVRVARHVARIVAPLIVDFFAYAARPDASARRAARCRLLHLHRATGCLGTSRGSSHGSSTTSSTTPHDRVPRHVTRLITRLVDHFFDYAARPGAPAHCAARHTVCRRLL
jgi:hypothetical protein